MDMSRDPREWIQMIWRRKWFFLIPAILAFVITQGVMLSMPELYRSQATILIEPQDIPEDMVSSLVTKQIDQQIQSITRELMVPDKLLQIADRHGLYADERDQLSRGALAGRMRERIETETILTEFNDQHTGRTGRVTVAFQISFLDTDPNMARQITNELVSIYLSSSLESRRAVAEQTTNFLSSERGALDQEVATIEDELTQFKIENRGLLPEDAAFKRQLLSNVEQRLRNFAGDLRVLGDRESYLGTQLALIDEFETSGGGAATPEGRLEALRAEFASARARYSPSHPDVVRLGREVRSLQNVVGARAGSSALAQQEEILTAELAALRERYTDDHPDVQRVQRERASLRNVLEDGAARDGGATTARRSGTYVQLSAQLNGVRSQIAAVQEQQALAEEERVALQEELAKAPEVQREYTRLMRRLDNAVADRAELAEKETTAQLRGALDTTAAGERLTLIEPPGTPSSPYSPKKLVFLAIGFVLAMGSGTTSLALAEILDRSIRSARDLAKIVGDQPLVTIPVIVTAADRRRFWVRRGGVAAFALVVVGIGIGWVHQRVVPLDVLAAQATAGVERWVSSTKPSL